jgi:glycosyltransferase involved in cell wall biosynthesis
MKIIYLTSYKPRKCGIATFTGWLRESIHKVNSRITQDIVVVTEPSVKRKYPKEVKFEIKENNLESYISAAEYINKSGADALVLQHEFGLFGGEDGDFVFDLLKKVKIPLITFLHTIPVLKYSKNRSKRIRALKKFSRFSKYLVTTSEIGKKFLIENRIDSKKVITIAHGALDLPLLNKKERDKLKEKHSLKGKFVISTYGLMAKKKGADFVVEAIEQVKEKYPNVVYLILGKQHPVYSKKNAKDYYKQLLKGIKEKGLQNNVKIIDKYLSQKEIGKYLQLTDIFIIAYTTKTQISSGVIAHAICAGCCVLSTPFVYGKDMVGKEGERGFYIDYFDSKSIVKKLNYLLKNPLILEQTRKKAYKFGRSFTWEKVAKKTIGLIG